MFERLWVYPNAEEVNEQSELTVPKALGKAIDEEDVLSKAKNGSPNEKGRQCEALAVQSASLDYLIELMSIKNSFKQTPSV